MNNEFKCKNYVYSQKVINFNLKLELSVTAKLIILKNICRVKIKTSRISFKTSKIKIKHTPMLIVCRACVQYSLKVGSILEVQSKIDFGFHSIHLDEVLRPILRRGFKSNTLISTIFQVST